MEEAESNLAFTCLKRATLSAVCFVQDYVQLQFDGPYLNLYVWPSVQTPERNYMKGVLGYRDALCERIGTLVQSVTVDPQRELSLRFEDGAVVTVSLREADRVGVEAAMLQDGTGGVWDVW